MTCAILVDEHLNLSIMSDADTTRKQDTTNCNINTTSKSQEFSNQQSKIVHNDNQVTTNCKFLLKQSINPQLANVDSLSTSICPTSEEPLPADTPTVTNEINCNHTDVNSEKAKVQKMTLNVPASSNNTTSSKELSTPSRSCPFSSHDESSTIKPLPNHLAVTSLFNQQRISDSRFITKSFDSTLAQTLSDSSPTSNKGKVFYKPKDESNSSWFQKFHWRDLTPQHHITHQFTVQWLWDNLVETNADLMEKAFNDHSMECLYEPVTKTSPFQSEPAIVVSQKITGKTHTSKPIPLKSKSYQHNSHRGASQLTKDPNITNQMCPVVEKSKSQSYCDKLKNKLNKWNDQSCLRQIHEISHKPIFLRSQSKCIGDSFLHFLRLIYKQDTTQDDTNTSQAILIRYIRVLYNLHRNHLSGFNTTCTTGTITNASTQSGDDKLSFGQRLKMIKSEGAKKPITITEYRIFVEYVINAFRTNISQLNPNSATYKPSHEALISSIRYQLEKLSLVFLDELSLPSQQDQIIHKNKSVPPSLKLFSKTLTKITTTLTLFQLNASDSSSDL